MKKTIKTEAIASKIADLATKKPPKKEIEKVIHNSITNKITDKVIDAEKKSTKKPVKKVIRDKRIELHVSEQELKKINSAAKKAKMTRSEYLRSKVLG